MSDLIERLRAAEKCLLLHADGDESIPEYRHAGAVHNAIAVLMEPAPPGEEEREMLADACAELADLIVNDDKLVNSSPVVASATVQLLRQAAAALRNPVDPWVPVEDGLPDVRESVWLIKWRGCLGVSPVTAGHRNEFEQWECDESGEVIEWEPTHWQRINPPKDGQ